MQALSPGAAFAQELVHVKHRITDLGNERKLLMAEIDAAQAAGDTERRKKARSDLERLNDQIGELTKQPTVLCTCV